MLSAKDVRSLTTRPGVYVLDQRSFMRQKKNAETQNYSGAVDLKEANQHNESQEKKKYLHQKASYSLF